MVAENSNSTQILTPPKLDNNILGIHKVSIENTDFHLVCAIFSKSIQIFVNFTIGMIGNKTGHLMECVKLWKIYQ